MSEAHHKAAILAIGDELTLGQKTDTNSQWLSNRLVSMAIIPTEHVTVPDDLELHVEALLRLASRVDVIISTGGLGPTADDLSRAALSRAMDDSLVEDELALTEVAGWFASRGRAMPPINRVQALRPSHGRTLPNLHGTAPGLLGTLVVPATTGEHRCDVFCLPGPPREMMPMFESQVVPRLRPPPGRTVRTRALHCIGIGESDLATLLSELMERTHVPLVGTTASMGIVSVRMRYEGPLLPHVADELLDRTEKTIRAKASSHIFGRDENTLADTIVSTFRERGQSVAFVESCTGGLLSGALTEVSGSSAVFSQGWVTYSNEAKAREVQVPGALLNLGLSPGAARTGPGAVSAEVAGAMASGGLTRSGADYCLAVTGIAGPTGGTSDKPVGTVFVGLARKNANGEIVSEVRQFRMAGDRSSIRAWSVTCALGMLWLQLSGHPDVRMLRQV